MKGRLAPERSKVGLVSADLRSDVGEATYLEAARPISCIRPGPSFGCGLMTKLRGRFSRNSPPTAATDLTGKIALTWMVRKADMPTKLTTEIITAAILGFEEQKRHIDAKIAELRAMRSEEHTSELQSLRHLV